MNYTNRALRIIFMGTPEFAVPSLQALVDNDKKVVAVITAPDKPAGRGRKLTASPVKACAEANNIPVLQPTNLKSEDFLEELKEYQADLQIVVAFRMLPEAVWNMPPLGTFNLHASLLPQYRGAAPIHWAIINGEQTTGLTTFFLKHEIDTGNIIFQEEEPISQTDTVGDVYERLMHKGAGLVVKTVDAIETGNYPREPQTPAADLKSAPKIFRETCEIRWDQPVTRVHDFIRGLSPFPGAWTTIDDQTVKILRAHIHKHSPDNSEPGKMSTDNESYLHIQTENGVIAVDELQWQGKKKMQIADFLRGNQLEL